MEADNKADGAAKVAAGKFESALGEAIGDVEIQAEGAALEIEGRIQQAAGAVQQAVGDAVQKTRAAAASVGDAYGRAEGAARDLRVRVEERPFAALALAALAGLIVGMLAAGRGPRIIYVKPRAPARERA